MCSLINACFLMDYTNIRDLWCISIKIQLDQHLKTVSSSIGGRWSWRWRRVCVFVSVLV